MALIPGVGKRVAAGAARGSIGRASTFALAGVGMAAGLASSNISERTFDMYSEAMLGNAQVDRAILGTDIGWGALMGFDPNPVHHIGLPPLKYINSAVIGDAFRGDSGREAAEKYAGYNVDAGYNRYTMPNSVYEYQAQVQRTGVAANEDYYGYDFPAPVARRRRHTAGATGDMVFGMHNMRLG